MNVSKNEGTKTFACVNIAAFLLAVRLWDEQLADVSDIEVVVHRDDAWLIQVHRADEFDLVDGGGRLFEEFASAEVVCGSRRDGWVGVDSQCQCLELLLTFGVCAVRLERGGHVSELVGIPGLIALSGET